MSTDITSFHLELLMLDNDADGVTFRDYFKEVLKEYYRRGSQTKLMYENRTQLYESIIYNSLVDPSEFNVIEGLTDEQMLILDDIINKLIDVL